MIQPIKDDIFIILKKGLKKFNRKYSNKNKFIKNNLIIICGRATKTQGQEYG